MGAFQKPILSSAGKRLLEIDRNYCSARNSLYDDYDISRSDLFYRYTIERKRLFQNYQDKHDRLEYGHAAKQTPLDYEFEPETEILDKDIAAAHAPQLAHFEAARLDIDHEYITDLQRLYKLYGDRLSTLDEDYQRARLSLYAGYRSKRDELDVEVDAARADRSQ